MTTLARACLATLPFLAPSALSAQSASFGGDTRAHLFVYLAFAAAWVMIGAWVYRIGSKVKRLSIGEQAKP